MAKSASTTRQSPLLEKAAPAQNCIVHTVFVLLPLLGGGIILFTLSELLQGDVDPKEQSVSRALAEFEPYMEIIMLLTLGGTLGVITSLARNIQVQVYFKRKSNVNENESGYTCVLYLINAFSALFNVIAYIAFVALGFYKINSDDPEEVDRHYYAALAFFIGSNLWAAMQVVLLFSQKQYSIVWKLLFLVVGTVSIGCASFYTISNFQVHVYEWIGIAFTGIYIMLIAVLFHIDPIDDELAAFNAFFCCCCCRRRTNAASK